MNVGRVHCIPVAPTEQLYWHQWSSKSGHLAGGSFLCLALGCCHCSWKSDSLKTPLVTPGEHGGSRSVQRLPRRGSAEGWGTSRPSIADCSSSLTPAVILHSGFPDGRNVFCFCFCRDRLLLCIPGWPWTYYIAQADLEHVIGLISVYYHVWFSDRKNVKSMQNYFLLLGNPLVSYAEPFKHCMFAKNARQTKTPDTLFSKWEWTSDNFWNYLWFFIYLKSIG